MERERKGKGLIIGLLFVTIFVMSIGFATMAANLTIEGNATISDTWNVQITGITKKESSTNVTETEAPGFTSTTANFNVQLKEPGDYAIYTIEVANTGSLDAVLESITETEGENGSDAIKYTVTPASGSEEQSDLVKKTGTHSFDVKVEYLETATGENAPAEGASKSYTVVLNYKQKTA